MSALPVLAFERKATMVGRRRVRRAFFERRSCLPVSAACVLANGVREALSALLAAPVRLRLLEPIVPEPDAWNAIAQGAQLFGVRGSVCDAAFVLRRPDALALASCAFGEEGGPSRGLSALEQEVLIRALRGIAGCLANVCGRDVSPLERILDIRGYTTYFELLLEQPAFARIGVALSRDPIIRGGATLRLEHLLDVEIEVSADFGWGILPAAAVLDLRAGANVPMTTRIGQPGRLRIGGAAVARGECGVLDGRHALIVTTVR